MIQEVPNSHRFTMRGLKWKLEELLASEKDDEQKEKIQYILTGIDNSIEAGEEVFLVYPKRTTNPES